MQGVTCSKCIKDVVPTFIVFAVVLTQWGFALCCQLMPWADLLGQKTTALHTSEFLFWVLLLSQAHISTLCLETIKIMDFGKSIIFGKIMENLELSYSSKYFELTLLTNLLITDLLMRKLRCEQIKWHSQKQ